MEVCASTVLQCYYKQSHCKIHYPCLGNLLPPPPPHTHTYGWSTANGKVLKADESQNQSHLGVASLSAISHMDSTVSEHCIHPPSRPRTCGCPTANGSVLKIVNTSWCTAAEKKDTRASWPSSGLYRGSCTSYRSTVQHSIQQN